MLFIGCTPVSPDPHTASVLVMYSHYTQLYISGTLIPFLDGRKDVAMLINVILTGLRWVMAKTDSRIFAKLFLKDVTSVLAPFPPQYPSRRATRTTQHKRLLCNDRHPSWPSPVHLVPSETLRWITWRTWNPPLTVRSQLSDLSSAWTDHLSTGLKIAEPI